jgi:hypothetical protein
VLAIAIFILGAVSNVLYFRMVAEVNRRLPPERQALFPWLHTGVYFRVLLAHPQLYPASRARRAMWICSWSAFGLFLVLVWHVQRTLRPNHVGPAEPTIESTPATLVVSLALLLNASSLLVAAILFYLRLVADIRRKQPEDRKVTYLSCLHPGHVPWVVRKHRECYPGGWWRKAAGVSAMLGLVFTVVGVWLL